MLTKLVGDEDSLHLEVVEPDVHEVGGLGCQVVRRVVCYCQLERVLVPAGVGQGDVEGWVEVEDGLGRLSGREGGRERELFL